MIKDFLRRWLGINACVSRMEFAAAIDNGTIVKIRSREREEKLAVRIQELEQTLIYQELGREISQFNGVYTIFASPPVISRRLASLEKFLGVDYVRGIALPDKHEKVKPFRNRREK